MSISKSYLFSNLEVEYIKFAFMSFPDPTSHLFRLGEFSNEAKINEPEQLTLLSNCRSLALHHSSSVCIFLALTLRTGTPL